MAALEDVEEEGVAAEPVELPPRLKLDELLALSSGVFVDVLSPLTPRSEVPDMVTMEPGIEVVTNEPETRVVIIEPGKEVVLGDSEPEVNTKVVTIEPGTEVVTSEPEIEVVTSEPGIEVVMEPAD